MMCGPLCHARWLTTGQRLVYMWTRKHGLTSQALRTLEVLVKFCLTYYFKLYFDMKVKHYISDAPYHILTSLRLLKTQPKKVVQIIIIQKKKNPNKFCYMFSSHRVYSVQSNNSQVFCSCTKFPIL